jgi:hypothetical protein
MSWMWMGRKMGAAALLLALAACVEDSPLAPPPPEPEPARPHADVALFTDAARAAWSYAEREYHPRSGLTNSVIDYPYATVWDIASGLSAMYCAHELGFIPTAEYDARMRRALLTLAETRIFEGVAFNKNYSTRTGAIAGRDDRDTQSGERGYGWSATDVGRLLVWLKIIAVNQPRHAADARRVVARMRLGEIVRDGYLFGTDVGADGVTQRYQEGRLGYEQYAARGFELWGFRAERALRLRENTLPITVLGVPLLADRRGDDFLTSEPFILTGLEVGWNPETAGLARRVLQVQEERFKQTGQVTFVSEDHIPRAPFYFYYYAINFHGAAFTVGAQGVTTGLDEPRWISAKAAFAWHALVPGPYTRRGVDAVGPARDPLRGWSSGVYEGSGAPTGSENINTAAVLLQSAVYSRTGRPLLYGG